MIKLHASTRVVMNGLTITAGSNPAFFASNGKEHPISFAINTVQTNVKFTTKFICQSTWSIIISLKKFAIASVIPHNRATRISFQITLRMSLNSTSYSEIPRIMVTLA